MGNPNPEQVLEISHEFFTHRSLSLAESCGGPLDYGLSTIFVTFEGLFLRPSSAAWK